MHYMAGVLLLVQFALLWVLEPSFDVAGLETLAWAVWLVAVTFIALSLLTLQRRGQAHPGRDCIETEVLVATGVYTLVRNPMYLGWNLMYLAVALFKPHWILAALGLLGIACVYAFTIQEERFLVGKFGDAYRRYMQAVPRFNVVAGAARLLRRRPVGDQGAP